MKNSEELRFRENLAKQLKKSDKTERKELFKKAREAPEYWQKRKEVIQKRQPEVLNDLNVLIDKKTLYHGSSISGIQEFNASEEETIGSGIYLTSEAKDAIGYARRRSRSRKGSPIIYETSIEDMKLLDLRKSENVREILAGFKKILLEELNRHELFWYYKENLERAITAISSEKIGCYNLGEVTQKLCSIFTKYITSLGYDGLITFEGGEGEDIDDHDSYVIFDVKKVKINRQHKIL